jgi:sugar/nucleoside kinase (ribokinase family)
VSATLCVGQAVVELVSEGDAFIPRVGGVGAAVAMAAAAAGAPISFAAAGGEDSWGRWLRDRLTERGVDVSPLSLVSEAQTPIATVTEDAYQLYGSPVVPPEEGLGEAVRACAGLVLGADALIAEAERALSLRARALALELDRPVIFAAVLRAERWSSRADAAASANACVPGALLVCAGRSDAELMTGEGNPERAALALVKAGARLALITLGPDGAMLRGELRSDVESVEADASERVTGALVGRLALSDFYPPVVAAALAQAVRGSRG